MKKLFLLTFVVMFSMGLFAQRESGVCTVQPKVGLTMSSITNDNGGLKIGFAGGAELEYNLSKMFSLSAGVMYSMQGSKGDLKINGVPSNLTYQLDYINIPILFHMYFTEGLSFKVGIQPGLCVNQKYKATIKETSVSEIDRLAGVKNTDISIPIGISYEFHHVVLDVRYQLGLTKVFEDNSGKNSVCQITIGYKFQL